MSNTGSVGDEIPVSCELIEVHVTELRLLFNPIDPSPPRERDLDPKAEEFIVSWARAAGRDARLALQIDVDQPGVPDEADAVSDAAFLLAGAVVRALGQTSVSALVRESMIIGGWVAMWRPLEIFLYDWWPIRAERRLYDRLRVMPTRVTFPTTG